MNNDKIKDHAEKAKGRAKEGTGEAVGNKEAEQKEKMQKSGGKIQAEEGDLKGREPIDNWVRRYLAAKIK